MPVTPYHGIPVTAVVVVDRWEGSDPKFGFYVTSQHPNIRNGGAGYDADGLVVALRNLGETYGARVLLSTNNPKTGEVLRWLVKDPAPVRQRRMAWIDDRVNSINPEE